MSSNDASSSYFRRYCWAKICKLHNLLVKHACFNTGHDSATALLFYLFPKCRHQLINLKLVMVWVSYYRLIYPSRPHYARKSGWDPSFKSRPLLMSFWWALMCHRVTETHLKDDSLVLYVTSPTMVSLRSNPPKCAVKARPSITNDLFANLPNKFTGVTVSQKHLRGWQVI